MQVSLSDDQEKVNLTDSKLCREPLRFQAPQFTGKSGDRSFAINQVLGWEPSSEANRIKFQLQGEPSETGLDFKGHLSGDGDAVAIKATARNVTRQPILSSQHSLIVNTEETPEFQDPTGERTLMYAETGWASLAQLIDPIHSGKHTIRMGANYNKVTVMWKMIVRFDTTGKIILAFALDKGFAFAGDHPEWPKGLLGGYRWGTIGPQESKELKGKIYLFKGTLDDLRMKYIKDFK